MSCSAIQHSPRRCSHSLSPTDVKLADGIPVLQNEVTFTLPDNVAARNDYIVVLMGDSGNGEWPSMLLCLDRVADNSLLQLPHTSSFNARHRATPSSASPSRTPWTHSAMLSRVSSRTSRSKVALRMSMKTLTARLRLKQLSYSLDPFSSSFSTPLLSTAFAQHHPMPRLHLSPKEHSSNRTIDSSQALY